MPNRRARHIRRGWTAGSLGLPDKPVTAAPDAAVTEHVRAAIDKRLRVILSREKGVRRGRDPEELHKMRVAVRRLRAMLRAAKPLLKDPELEELRENLGWLGRCLGPVRDLDVLLERLHEQAATLPHPERLGVEALITDVESERATARGRMLAALDSKRYARVLQHMAEVATRPAAPSTSDSREPVLALVRKQFSKLAKAVDEAGENPPEDVLHALRIHGKRLRYTSDLAKPLAGKPIRKLIRSTKTFQDVLGRHQDACVAEAHIRELLAKRPEVDVDMALAAGRLIEREVARRAEARTQWIPAWNEITERAAAL